MRYDRTLVQIRERSFLDLLDLTMLVFRERPRVLFLAAAAGILPWALLNVWLLSDAEFSLFWWPVLLVLETPWATAPLTVVLGDLMFGKPLRPARIARTLLLAIPAMLATQFAVRGILLATGFLYPLMAAQYSFLNEIILLERLRFWKIPRRSRDLSSGFEGELFIRWLGQIALGLIFVLCFSEAFATLSSALIRNQLTWYRPGLNDLRGLVVQTAAWIAITYFGVYRFFAYLDRRIRLEGWELDLRLREVNRGLQERSM